MVALVLAMSPVVSARAQVSGDLLPDPIDSPWLTRQLRTHVAPSVVEWIEIENAHEAYLDSFRILQKAAARYRSFSRSDVGHPRRPDDSEVHSQA